MRPIQNLVVFSALTGLVLGLASCGSGGGGGGGGGPVATIYVDGTNGYDTNDGLSLANAVQTIQKGIDLASNGWMVLVADGIYVDVGNKDLDFGGKAIHLKSAGGAIIDCEDSGRGFYFYSGETLNSIVDGFTIQNGNVSSPAAGGGIYCDGSSPKIINCTITNNKAVAQGTDDGYGGGVCCYNGSNPTIENCTITSNTASAQSGEFAYGGGIFCDNSSPKITNCTITGNSAAGSPSGGGGGNLSGGGGGIFCYNGSNPPISKCIIRNNSATYYGGGICCWDNCSPAITNSIIVNNATTINTYCGGGGLCCSSSNPTITNCTIANNTANYGGGILCYGSSPTLNNTILWGNSAATSGHQFYAFTASSLTLDHCDCPDPAGTITSDPKFTADYHLQADSPCIDAGSNALAIGATDLDGNPRIVDGNSPPDDVATVDIGAYEHPPQP
jgi:predicted outer membrane repeat protein